MSFQAMAEAVKAPLAGNDKLIFILLANYADDKNICWPSQATLAKESGLSDRSVRNITIRMEKLGYLRVLRRGSGVTPSKYQLVFNPANTNESESISKVGPEKISSPKMVMSPENSSGVGRKIFPVREENISADPINEPINKDLSLKAREPAVILPEVQNAILTQRVPQVSSSLPSAFPMSLTWNPGPEFEKYARMLGLTNPAYSEAQLNEFRMYWEPTGRCFHHTQWIQKFVQRLKSDLARGLTNDQRNNNSSSRTGNRPASAGNSAWHRGLDAMRELLAEQGYLDEATALGGSSGGYDAGYAPVRHPLASDASTFELQGDAGRIYEGDYADFDRWEGDDQAD